MTERGPSPLAVPAFRALWATTVLSNVGSTIQAVGAAWLMTTLSRSSLLVALVQASANLPTMILALWAGAIADAYDRRRIMMAAQLFMLVVSFVLATLSWEGNLTPIGLLAMTFLIGVGTAVNWPAMQVTVSDIVPVQTLPRAVALNGLGVNLARSIGPALGGAILATVGATTAFFINAISYIPLVATLARWHHKVPARTLPRERIGAAMMAGLRYGALSPALQAIGLRALAFGAAASAIPALMPLIARDLVSGGPFVFGTLLAAFGGGAIAGAFCSAYLRARWSGETIVSRLSLFSAMGAAVAGTSHFLPLTIIAMAITGAAWLVVLTTFNVTTQLASPRWVVARALSLYQMTTYGGMVFGSWSFGWLADRIGCGNTLFVAAAAMAIVSALGRVRPIRGDQPDLSLRANWRTPDTGVPIQLRSGPIVVTVDHRVHAQDAEAFVALMGERSRILRRDGARDWTLQQDLEDIEAWAESYRLPTWLDYILLNQRRTHDDLAIHEALEAVRVPGSSIVVHRRIQRHAAGVSRAQSECLDDPGVFCSTPVGL